MKEEEMKTVNERLAIRWKNLLEAISPGVSMDTIVGWRSIISDLYSAPNRLYHNLDHIDRLLGLWYSDGFFTSGRAKQEEFMGQAEMTKMGYLLEVAIWFHDVIYRPGVSGNERASADMAKCFLTAFNASDSDIEIVEKAIMATTYDRQPQSRLEEMVFGSLSSDQRDLSTLVTGYLNDLDLSGLAASYEDFSKESVAIREEYGLVTDEAFAWGRTRFFATLLTSPIYMVAKHLEGQARSNIKKHIIDLLSSID